MQRRTKKNEGEVPQYYVENSHPAIIDPVEWQLVQIEFKRRKAIGRQYSGASVLSSKLICEDCGDYYGSKVWHSNDTYRKVVWRCNGKYSGDHKCETPAVEDNEVKRRFMEALSTLTPSKANILDDCRIMQAALSDCTEIDAELELQMQEAALIAEMTHQFILANSHTAQDQTEYTTRYESLVMRYETVKATIEELQHRRSERQDKADSIGAFMFVLHESDLASLEFNPKLWNIAVDHAVIRKTGTIAFHLINGMEITA